MSSKEKYHIRDQATILLGNPPLPVKHIHEKDRIRYLGIWLEYNSHHSREKAAIRMEVKKLANKMKHKSITTEHIHYIINHVVIPRIVYRSTHLILTDSWCNLVMLPLYTVIKHSARLHRTTENNILFHSDLFNIQYLFNTWLGISIDNLLFLFDYWTLLLM